MADLRVVHLPDPLDLIKGQEVLLPDLEGHHPDLVGLQVDLKLDPVVL